MLSKKNRIGDRRLIEKLFTEGQTYKDPFFIFKYQKSDHNHPRFAVSVSKKIFKSAVKRNHLRRQVYGAIRPYLSDVDQGLMAFVIIRSSFSQNMLDFQGIKKHIHQFINRISSHAK